MRERTIDNAVVVSTMLGWEDHGVMTASLMLEGSGWGQGFGGYCFGSYDRRKKTDSGFGVDFIKYVLAICGVDQWEKVKGQHVRVDHDFQKVYRIGHVIKDEWFDPEAIR